MEYDFIATKAINSTASKVTSGSKIKYECKVKEVSHIIHSDLPIPTTWYRGKKAHDFTGKKFGRFTVVGFHRKTLNSGNKVCWVVKCVCGKYEIRTSNSINKSIKNNYDACCLHCDHWKRKSYHNIIDNKKIISKNPLLIKIFKGPKENCLTGYKMGKLTIIGYYGSGNSSSGSAWVAQCSCGNYTLRHTKSIKKNTNLDHCCDACFKQKDK